MNIQKAAVRASNNAMRGYIPHNAIVSQGGEDCRPAAGAGEATEGQEGQETGKAYRDKHRQRKTRSKAECGRCTGCKEAIRV